MANYRMNKIAIGSNTYECAEWYGDCSTQANTQVKSVSISGFDSGSLVKGVMVTVRFVNAQEYNGAPKLNVSSTGKKSILKDDGSQAGQYAWKALEYVTFIYDGTFWVMVDSIQATTTYWGKTKLSNTIADDATTALTPKAVYDAGYLTLADLPVWDGSVT